MLYTLLLCLLSPALEQVKVGVDVGEIFISFRASFEAAPLEIVAE